MAKDPAATTPALYHGTSRAFATAMAGTAGFGTIDVTRGRGEFGRGFYAQDSISGAFRRGQLLYGNNAAILVLTLNNHAYHALTFRRLTLQSVQRLDAILTGNNTRHSYATADDVIVGPLVGNARIVQQKFQSMTAQALLNGLQTLRTVLP